MRQQNVQSLHFIIFFLLPELYYNHVFIVQHELMCRRGPSEGRLSLALTVIGCLMKIYTVGSCCDPGAGATT